MTQTDQLQQLLDKAVESRWVWQSSLVKKAEVSKVNGFIFLETLTKPYQLPYSIETVLFGDGLSFLKASFNDKEHVWFNAFDGSDQLIICDNCNEQFGSKRDSSYRKCYQSKVVTLIFLPDNERIPTLHSLVFEK